MRDLGSSDDAKEEDSHVLIREISEEDVDREDMSRAMQRQELRLLSTVLDMSWATTGVGNRVDATITGEDVPVRRFSRR